MTLANPVTTASRRVQALLIVLFLGTSWLHHPIQQAVRASVAAITAPAAIDPSLPRIGAAEVSVVVQAVPGATEAAAAAVRSAGGTVGAALPIIDGFAARLPAAALDRLATVPGIRAVSKNSTGSFAGLSSIEQGNASTFTKSTAAQGMWNSGYRGDGVGVAVIDTGISPMNDVKDDIVYGPDLSGEGTTTDTYGHGTVMAGLIAGDGTDSAGRAGGAFLGMAPKSRLVSVKVAGRNGAADVTTMLQAMHWVSAYKDQYNIRVLNISWGLPSGQSPSVDPVNYAVQRLWRQGIVVVVAAGNNGGNPAPYSIMKPGDDPLAITVGAYDENQTTSLDDDAVPAWSSRGPTVGGLSKPDIVAPGRYVVAQRSYGSTVEEQTLGTSATQGFEPSYIRGSGTSQATAVTSGAVALLLQARPNLTPDQVKQILKDSATPILGAGDANVQGKGRLRLNRALNIAAGPATQQSSTANGLGSIEESRGGPNVPHVESDCDNDGTRETVIQGEIDVRCVPWDGNAWTGNAWTGNAWTGNAWTGNAWTGNAWTGNAWTGNAWTGNAWTGNAWTGNAWTGNAWTGNAWTGSVWTGNAWTGNAWTGNAWTGNAWTGNAWTGNAWTGNAWTGNAWTSGSYGDDATLGPSMFATAFYGLKPPAGVKLVGEVSEPLDAGSVTTVDMAGTY